MICPWCKELIEDDQPVIIEDDVLHLGCSIQRDDDVYIWGYNGDCI